jgi:hypothetical protein
MLSLICIPSTLYINPELVTYSLAQAGPRMGTPFKPRQATDHMEDFAKSLCGLAFMDIEDGFWVVLYLVQCG